MVMRHSKHVGSRSQAAIELDRLRDATMQSLGLSVARARRRRGLTQAAVSSQTGISRSSLSRLELGLGTGASIGTWLALAQALRLTARFEILRDQREDLVDAGHLEIQELLLRLGRTTGYSRSFELSIPVERPSGWVDVFLRNDTRRRLLVLEAWNVFGNFGAGRTRVRPKTRRRSGPRRMAGGWRLPGSRRVDCAGDNAKPSTRSSLSRGLHRAIHGLVAPVGRRAAARSRSARRGWARLV